MTRFHMKKLLEKMEKLLKEAETEEMNARQAAKAAAKKVEELERIIAHNVSDIRLLNKCIIGMIRHESPCKYCNDYKECTEENKDVSSGCDDWFLEVNAITQDDVKGDADDSKGIFGASSES